MAENGNERRQRTRRYSVRFCPMEDAVLHLHAGHAGLTIASYLRRCAIELPPPKAGRGPSVDHQLTVHLLAEIGRLTTAFDRATESAAGIDGALIETAFRDVSEMRLVLLETVRRAP